MPASAFVDAGLLFVKPEKDGPECVRSVVGQLVSGKGGSGFESGERNLFAGEKLGGESLRLGLGASQGWKVRQSDRGLRLMSMTIGTELQARQQARVVAAHDARPGCKAEFCNRLQAGRVLKVEIPKGTPVGARARAGGRPAKLKSKTISATRVGPAGFMAAGIA